MSTVSLQSRDDRARPQATSRVARIAVWVVAGVLALLLTGSGIAKLSGDDAMVTMFADIGVGQWLRYTVGGLEIAAAIGLLIPRLSSLAAAGVVALMVGAVSLSVARLDESPLVPAIVLLVAAAIAYARWPRADAAVVALVRRGAQR